MKMARMGRPTFVSSSFRSRIIVVRYRAKGMDWIRPWVASDLENSSDVRKMATARLIRSRLKITKETENEVQHGNRSRE